ncbi:MAG: hypothetical protein ACK4QW_17155, partial [Alphaproteobacteria bacterium]
VRPKLLGDGREPDLLSTEDLDAGSADGAEPGVRSILNARLLDDIARDALPRRAPAQPYRPAWLADPVHLYVTTANLRGVPYRIRFRDGARDKLLTGHAMMSHGDRVHFRVHGLGAASWRNDWTDGDRDGTDVAVDDLFAPGGPSAAWEAYTLAARATGAFPLGLAARGLPGSLYEQRSWPMDVPPGVNLEPDWPAGWPKPDAPYRYVSVDGGLINNEPFEMTRFAIRRDGRPQNPRGAEDADTAVVMVDPFPDGPAFDEDYPADDRLRAIALALFPALKNQVRFKPGELVAAVAEDVFSRYMIAPRRADAAGTAAPYAIACGALGGFGGFLDEAFRDHDFQLGRRNCQKFLRDSLAFPDERNRVLAHGYRHLEPAARRALAGGDGALPVIPLVGTARDEVPAPTWPKMAPERLDELDRRVGQRADRLVPLLIAEVVPNRLMRVALRVLWGRILREKLLGHVRYAVLKDLILRDLLGGTAWRIADPEARRVIAALADPRWQLRSAAGIARTTGLPEAEVRRHLAAQPGLAVRERIGRRDLYRLADRRLGRRRRIPVVRWIVQRVVPLAVD